MNKLILSFCLATLLGGLVVSADSLVFKKVDFFESVGDDEKKRDARIELESETRMLILCDEKKGTEKATYLKVSYDKITKITYERSSHRRYGAAALVSPLLLFTKGKKHWMTIEFEDVSENPSGHVYTRLDKKNYRQILAALEAGTGLEIEEIIEN